MAQKERLYFESVRENRDGYFVEYQPPIADNTFANLSLVYPDKFELEEVGKSIRIEMDRWMARYPVPLTACAYDAAENIIRPNGEDGFLTGWLTPGSNKFSYSWKLDELPSFLNDNSNLPDWRTIYPDIRFKTDAEVKSNAQKYLTERRKQVFGIKIILTIWVAVIPASWAIIQYLGPEWLGICVLIYSFSQAWKAWRKLMGSSKSSRGDQEAAEKESKMAHYYYHCERNPDGFIRLKAENFAKEISERTRKEAAELAEGSNRKPPV